MKIISACPDKSIVRIWIKLYKYISARLKFPIKYQTFIGACPKPLLSWIFLILLFALSLSPVLASNEYNFGKVTDGQITEALGRLVPLRFLPSHPLYLSITIKENLQRFFQPSSSKKAEFDLVLAGKRIKEVYQLLLRGDVKGASRALTRYSKRLAIMTRGLEKARSQNQEVGPVVDRMAEGLRDHETLFFAIGGKRWEFADNNAYDDNLTEALDSFATAVTAIDEVRPGLRDRFESVKWQGYLTPPAKPASEEAGGIFEASPSSRPRRIIL